MLCWNGSYLLVLFKFLLAFLVFEEINRLLPYVEGLDQIFVVLLASLICSIMPWNLMVFLGMGLIVGQCYGIGIEIAGFALALIVIMVILYLRFTPQDALVLLLTPVAFSFGVPCLIPIGYGLTRTPSSAISAGFGVILYYFMELVSDRGRQRRKDTESPVSFGRTDEKSGDDGYDYCICYCSGDRLCGTQTGSGICLAYCGFWRRYCIYDHYGCRRNFS